MTPEVTEAINEVKNTFLGHVVDVVEETQGGAYVTVQALAIGEKYTPSTTWLGFLIPFQYPRADVYPHFVDGTIKLSDGRPHGNGISAQSWQGRPALQISRKSNRWNAETDTAALKATKVLEWFSAQ